MPRINRFVGLLKDLNIECAVIVGKANIFYLTGFKALEGVAAYFTVDGEAALYVPPLEYDRAVEETGGKIEVVPYSRTEYRWSLPREPIIKPLDEIIAERIKSGGKTKLGAELSTAPYQMVERIKSKFEGVELVDITQALQELRAVKDAEEVERIRKATRLTEEALREGLKRLEAGASEYDIAAAIEYSMKLGGSDAPAFPTIVASGENAALPHATLTPRRIKSGDLVVIDLGATFRGYCSDITRTVSVGRIGSREKDVFYAVLEAQRKALSEVGPGVKAEAVDSAARAVLEEYGYAKFYIHSTGHGVGIEVHELPRLSANSNTELKPGMIVTVEPGVYIRGLTGVRIEDIVLVTESGVEVLSKFEKDLVV